MGLPPAHIQSITFVYLARSHSPRTIVAFCPPSESTSHRERFIHQPHHVRHLRKASQIRLPQRLRACGHTDTSPCLAGSFCKTTSDEHMEFPGTPCLMLCRRLR